MDPVDLEFREATSRDVPEMVRAREPDTAAGPADHRMARYLDGEHHPQKALPPRVAYIALQDDSLVGYIGGHLTRRYQCDGELQYLYVVPAQRRRGVATHLLQMLTRWFTEQGASKVCLGVEEDNTVARGFFAHHGATDLNSSFLVWADIKQVLGD